MYGNIQSINRYFVFIYIINLILIEYLLNYSITFDILHDVLYPLNNTNFVPFNFLWRLNPICCAHQKLKCAIAYRHIDNLSWHSNEKLAITSYWEQDLHFGISTFTRLIMKRKNLLEVSHLVLYTLDLKLCWPKNMWI